MHRTQTLAAVLLLLLAGCDSNPLGTVDPRGTAPSVANVVIAPAGIRLDTLTAVNGVYALAPVVKVRVQDPDGNAHIASVTVQALTPEGADAGSAVLHDDGAAPDAAANDGIFSGALHMSLNRAGVGTYRFVVAAQDDGGLTGTVAISNFPVTRHVSIPWLYNLVAPSTVTIPTGGGVAFRIAVAAGDSDGIADIQDVRLNIPEGSNPTGYLHLLDNGQLANGDSVAGDGNYAIILQVTDSPTVRKTYTLRLQAVDRAGDTSATITQPLTMQ